MAATEVFVNYHNFNTFWVPVPITCINPCQKYGTGTQVKKSNCQGILQNLFGAGAGAERNNFGSATLGTRKDFDQG